MRTGIAFIAVCAAAIIRPTTQSRAQPIDSSRWQAFTRSAFYEGLINRAIAKVPPAVFQRCPTLVSNGSKVIILKPVTFGDDGFPNGIMEAILPGQRMWK